MNSIHNEVEKILPKHPYLPFLEEVLTPGRLDHSLGVMKVMGELAEVYGLDYKKARTIGILHDAGKNLSLDQQKRLIDEGNIRTYHACEKNYVLYMHAPVGSFFVHKELGITDELILDAITTHTYYGKSQYFDDPLCWCLRFSDILEPTRNWGGEKLIFEGSKRLRELAYNGRMAEGALLQTETIIEWYKEKGFPVHPNMVRVKLTLSAQISDDSLFAFAD